MSNEPCLNCLERRITALEAMSPPEGITTGMDGETVMVTPEATPLAELVPRKLLQESEAQFEKLVDHTQGVMELAMNVFGSCSALSTEARLDKDQDSCRLKLLKIQQMLDEAIEQFTSGLPMDAEETDVPDEG